MVADPCPAFKDKAQQYITGHSGRGKRWADIHLKELKLPSVNHPARRLCGFHAMLAIRHAEVKGWIEKGSVVVPDAAWELPGFEAGKQWLLGKFLAGTGSPHDFWDKTRA